MAGSFWRDLCLRIARKHPELGRPKELADRLAPFRARLERVFQSRGMDEAVRQALALLDPRPAQSPKGSLRESPEDLQSAMIEMERVFSPVSTCWLCGGPRSAADWHGDLCGFCAAREKDPQVQALIGRLRQSPGLPFPEAVRGLELSPALLEVVERWTRIKVGEKEIH